MVLRILEYFKQWILILVSFLLSEEGFVAQTFEDKSYYLVDSLDLSNSETFEIQILDSCLNVFHHAQSETERTDAILYVVKESYDQNIWPKYNLWLMQFASKKLSDQSLSQLDRNKYLKLYATTYSNLGYYYDDRGDFATALQSYHKGLKISESINDSAGISHAFMNIGAVYQSMQEVFQALAYYEKSLAIDKALKDTIGIARTVSNIGAIYSSNQETEKALAYLNESIELKSAIKDWEGVASSYINLGITLKQMNHWDEALASYLKGLEILKELNDSRAISTTLYNIGNLYFESGKITQAQPYLTESLNIAQSYDFLPEIKETSLLLSRVYEEKGKFKDALKMFKLYTSAKDSITNEASLRASIQLQTQYEYEKKVTADSIKNTEAEKIYQANLEAQKAIGEKHRVELSLRKKQNIFLFIGLGILAIFGFFMYNRFKVSQRQKHIINEQKKVVEFQKEETERQHKQLETVHKEVNDSIHYARQLQLAILPSIEDLNTHLDNSFVLFLPKDIVSGDFYWMQQLQEQDKVLFAVADCTGHGVPGAMVSVVCSNALNRVVKEFGIHEPAAILNKTRELVIETFSRSGKNVRDGMDIALCALEEGKLTFSGANNPLWIIRDLNKMSETQQLQKGVELTTTHGLLDFKANKQPIGLYGEMKDFDQIVVPTFVGDMVYIFTDGYADQFGGEKDKKLMSKPFKRKLLEIQNLSIQEQKEELRNFIRIWKGKNEQVDDICIIGVRIR